MLSNKKICFVLPAHWKTEFGGAEYQSKLIIDYLRENYGQQYSVFYVCRTFNEDINFSAKNVVSIHDGSLGIRKYGYFFDSFGLYKVLKRLDPDIIYQRVGCAYTGVCAYYAKKFNKRMIWHVSLDNEVKPFKFRLSRAVLFQFIEKRFLEYGIKNAHHIITQTKYQSELLEENYRRKCDIIVPNFHPKPSQEVEKENKTKIVWIANIKKEKRPDIFIKLAETFKSDKDIQFLMVGRENARNKIWQHNLEADIERVENLEYLGEQPISEVNRILCHSHVLVNTSSNGFEGFPNTYIQAWMRQVPVVSLNVDPDDVLKNRKIGFYAGSQKKLITEVRRLIEDHKLRNEMAKKAQSYAFQNHSIQKNLPKIIELIQK